MMVPVCEVYDCECGRTGCPVVCNIINGGNSETRTYVVRVLRAAQGAFGAISDIKEPPQHHRFIQAQERAKQRGRPR